MAVTENNARIIAGRNVYTDDKGQPILYVPSKKTGYMIRPKDESNFQLYHNRWAIAIALAMLIASFTNDWKLPLIAGGILGGLLEARYRFTWLPTLTRIENFKPAKKLSLIDGLVAKASKKRCMLLGVLYLAFGVLLLINEIQVKAPIYFIVGAVVILAVCLYMAYCYFKAASLIKE